MNEVVQRAAYAAHTMLNQRTGERKAIEMFFDLAEEWEEVDNIIYDLRLCHSEVRKWMEYPQSTQQEREEYGAAADMYRVLLCKLGVRIENWRGSAEQSELEQDYFTIYDYGLLLFAVSMYRQYQRSGSPQHDHTLDDLMKKIDHLRELDYPECEKNQ